MLKQDVDLNYESGNPLPEGTNLAISKKNVYL